MNGGTKHWSHPSVVALAGDADPIELIAKKARNLALHAIEEGWQGPPFDPFKLAEHLNIETVPLEDLFEARTVPSGSRGFRIEFNPNKPRRRIRFSVAHEIAHTLFPDCRETVRRRGTSKTARPDDWQLELLCNLAAAEFIMPIGTGMALEREPVTIDTVIRLRDKYQVSTEAISLRLASLTTEPCTVFVAARSPDATSGDYRVDYSVASRSSGLRIPPRLRIRGSTVLSECVAVGFSAKGTERWATDMPEMDIECIGIPPYPHHQFPRIVGIVRGTKPGKRVGAQIKYLRGDALEPRGKGSLIIAHIVNDKTPNWGAGFPQAVRNKWPSVQDDFRDWVARDRTNLSLGKVHVSSISDDLSIVHMAAQHGYGPSRKPRIRYWALESCLDQLAAIAEKQKASIHMPRIGTGQAGGNWWVIAELIDQSVVRQHVEVTVYDLPNPRRLDHEQGLLNFTSLPQ